MDKTLAARENKAQKKSRNWLAEKNQRILALSQKKMQIAYHLMPSNL